MTTQPAENGDHVAVPIDGMRFVGWQVGGYIIEHFRTDLLERTAALFGSQLVPLYTPLVQPPCVPCRYPNGCAAAGACIAPAAENPPHGTSREQDR